MMDILMFTTFGCGLFTRNVCVLRVHTQNYFRIALIQSIAAVLRPYRAYNHEVLSAMLRSVSY